MIVSFTNQPTLRPWDGQTPESGNMLSHALGPSN